MCGIAGIWAGTVDSPLARSVEKMTAALTHRGPDAQGVWCSEDGQLALGHRRLSILDLSEHGAQPMTSNSGRYIIAYNGEIYNFKVIQAELEEAYGRVVWRGHSDTEILLFAIEAWGIDRTLSRLSGMFAFALWDKDKCELTLVRDRIGEKPLYFGWTADKFVFGSELKAIQAVCQQELVIDRRSIAEFLKFGYVPAPRSIYADINKLLPGHYLTVSGPQLEKKSAAKCYWSLREIPGAHRNLETGEYTSARLHNILRQSVSEQMVADVPLGAFLSGGIDSSLIVSLMQSQSDKKVHTYTIGFNETAFDEAPYAAQIAKHLGTDHTEFYLDATDAQSIISVLPEVYDEPFADSSQIPSILVSRLTKQHVTVALSGDGGDELFSGYPRYQTTARTWAALSRYPSLIRQGGSKLLGALSAQQWDNICSKMPRSLTAGLNGRRISKMSSLLNSRSLEEMYVGLMSHWSNEQSPVLGVGGVDLVSQTWPDGETAVDQMRRWDLTQYLPDDLLVKVDRASMSAGLEVRAPFLDRRVVDFALNMNDRQMIVGGVGKAPLREILANYVPSHFYERPKAGFSVPLAEWLRHPLREWAEALLCENKLLRQGYFDVALIRSTWQEHLYGTYDRSLQIWNVLIFQQWLEHNEKF